MSMMPLDRLKDPLGAFVRGSLPQIDYLGLYPGTVVHQRGANSFDFIADDQRIGNVSGVPLMLPFPGFSLTLDIGAQPRCLLGWDGGKATSPRIQLWAAAGLKTLAIQAEDEIDLVATKVNINNGSNGAARNGDSVKVTLTALEIGQIQSPTGACSGGPIEVFGTITSGSSTTEIG